MDAASSTRSSQALLATALLDPDMPAPARFGVHRNTVVSSLVRALAEGFPSIERLVGPAFFSAMAARFARESPPSHAVLLAYGAGFADFIRGFEPVAHLPYLADVAHLDGLRRRAWHAADVSTLSVASLAASDPETLAARRITLHPSVGVLASPYPARSLWAMQNGDDNAPDTVDWSPETTMVWRANDTIRVDALDTEGLSLLEHARRAPTLADLLNADAELEAQSRAQAFGLALRNGLLVDTEALEHALATVPDASLFDTFLPPFPIASFQEISP